MSASTFTTIVAPALIAKCGRALVDIALAPGGPDNITVIVAGYVVS